MPALFTLTNAGDFSIFAASAAVVVTATGSPAGGTLSFFASPDADPSRYVPVQATRLDTGTAAASHSLAGGVGAGFTINTPGMAFVKVSTPTGFTTPCTVEGLTLPQAVSGGGGSGGGGTGGAVTTDAVRAAAGAGAYRAAVAAADALASPGAPTATDQPASAGTFGPGAAVNAAVAAYNRWGTTPFGAVATVTTSSDALSTHSIRLAIAQVTGADGYEIACSVDAAPKWSVQITEGQRATGGVVTSTGVFTAVGTPGAGLIDVRQPGTQDATTATEYAQNTALTPAALPAIDCTGKHSLHLFFRFTPTDLRVLPVLEILPFESIALAAGEWFAYDLRATGILTGRSQPLAQKLTLDVQGATSLVVAVSKISGGTATLYAYTS
jgi:hypothetical protein